MVDLNPDTSPFKHIGNFIEDGKDLIDYTDNNYRLYLFVVIQGERQFIEIRYDNNGKL